MGGETAPLASNAGQAFGRPTRLLTSGAFGISRKISLTPVVIIDGGTEVAMRRKCGALFAIADGEISAVEMRVILADVARNG